MKYLKLFEQYFLIDDKQLNENKLYPKNIISNVTKRLNNDSKDVLDKLAIFGLFKEHSPFSTTDIQSIKTVEELDNLYKEWLENIVTKITSIKGGLKGNKTVANDYIKAYTEHIRSLNDPKPFSIKKYEVDLVDLVNNNHWIEKEKNTSSTLYNINNPYPNDIMYEDDDILIVKGDSRGKCIIYGQGYTWCISRTNLNYYTTYRIEQGASIYFALNKKLPIDSIERLCVILHYNNDMYGIADKTNSGNRSGGINVAQKGFSYVDTQLPWLKGMSEYFPHIKVTDSEKEYDKLVKRKYAGDDLYEYIKYQCEKIRFNGEKVEPVDFLRDYSVNNPITNNQFKLLDNDMITQIIESGISCSDIQISMMSSSNKVRYAVVRSGETNLDLYSYEERQRVYKNLGEKMLDIDVVDSLVSYTSNNEIVNEILEVEPSYIAKMGKYEIFKIFLKAVSSDKQIDFILKYIYPMVDDKEYCNNKIMRIIDKNIKKDFFIEYVLVYVKDDMVNQPFNSYIDYLNRSDCYTVFINYIFPYIKDNLDNSNVDTELHFTISHFLQNEKIDFMKKLEPLLRGKDQKISFVSTLIRGTNLFYDRYNLLRGEISDLDTDTLSKIVVDETYYKYIKDIIVEKINTDDVYDIKEYCEEIPSEEFALDILSSIKELTIKSIYVTFQKIKDNRNELCIKLYNMRKGDMSLNVAYYLLENLNGYERFNVMFPYIETILKNHNNDTDVVKYFLKNTEKEKRNEVFNKLYPYVKSNISKYTKDVILEYLPNVKL